MRTKSLARRAVLLLSSLALAGGATFTGTAGLALAQPGAVAATSACYSQPNAHNCDNKDPLSTGCSADAYTASSKEMYWYNDKSIDVGTIQNRYSPHCGTNWTRFIPNAYPPADTGTFSEVIIVQACLNHQFVTCSDQYSSYRTSSSSDPYSNMVYAPTTTATAFVWVESIDAYNYIVTWSDAVDA